MYSNVATVAKMQPCTGYFKLQPTVSVIPPVNIFYKFSYAGYDYLNMLQGCL